MVYQDSNSPGNKKVSQKKCPACGQWTEWHMQAEDCCSHCGQLLSTHIQEKEQRAEKIKNAPTGLFPILETDAGFVKAGKQIANFGHMIFTAFVAFMVWLITVVAG